MEISYTQLHAAPREPLLQSTNPCILTIWLTRSSDRIPWQALLDHIQRKTPNFKPRSAKPLQNLHNKIVMIWSTAESQWDQVCSTRNPGYTLKTQSKTWKQTLFHYKTGRKNSIFLPANKIKTEYQGLKTLQNNTLDGPIQTFFNRYTLKERSCTQYKQRWSHLCTVNSELGILKENV